MKNKEMFANKKVQYHKLLFMGSFACLFSMNLSYSQEVQDSITYHYIAKALNNGEISKLATVFNSKVDITLPNQAGIYSNIQAYYILKDFFLKNPPTSFKIITESFNNGSNFIVGNMFVNNKPFRVCYLVKYTENKIFIYQFSIEE